MRLVTRIEGDLRMDMETEIRVGRMAALGAVAGVGGAIKDNWRGQIASAGLGRRLGNTVRMEAYPPQGSLNAAALVWSRAKKIVGAFETGVEIRAKNVRFLAIPLPAAGKSTRNGRITPGEWERRRGRKLQFIQRRRGGALLVDNGQRAQGGSGRLARDQFGPRVARGFRNRSVPIFVLVPRVRLQKRLGLLSAADRLANSMGARLVAGWKD